MFKNSQKYKIHHRLISIALTGALMLGSAVSSSLKAEAQEIDPLENGTQQDEAFRDNEFRLSFGGILNFSNSSLDIDDDLDLSTSSESKIGYGLAVLFEVTFWDRMGAESGLTLTRRRHSYSVGDVSLTQSSTWIQIPVIGRYSVTDWLSIGLGPYFGFRLGDVDNDFTAGSPDDLTINITSQEVLDIGVHLVGTWIYHLDGPTAIFVEGRYIRGLSDFMEGSGVTQRTNDFSVLAGLSLQFGGF
jgi:hypothetical protein